MKYKMGVVASLGIMSVVVLAFGLLDSYIVTALGLTEFTSCVIHGALTAMFALENWCLLKDLQAIESKNTENKPSGSPGTVIQKTLIENLVRQNALLERRNIEYEAKLKRYKWNSVMQRSWSLSMESPCPRWQRRWAIEPCSTAPPPE